MHLHDATNTRRLGPPLSKARSIVILVHGRGSSADDLGGLARLFAAPGITCLLPEAANSTWYPHRFLVPPAQNEPWLSSALAVVDTLVAESLAAGISSENIALAGFSQGACLVLEYASRHPRRYAFVAGLSGALVGPTDTVRDCVDLKATPLLIACAEHDAHIPLEHIEHSATALAAFNADVTKLIFSGATHTVFAEEVAWLKNQAARLPRSA